MRKVEAQPHLTPRPPGQAGGMRWAAGVWQGRDSRQASASDSRPVPSQCHTPHGVPLALPALLSTSPGQLVPRTPVSSERGAGVCPLQRAAQRLTSIGPWLSAER